MGDPFSVAGSAVGVISLAITTCQGVISYYNSWDTQDQSISDAKGKTERLHNSLSALEEILPKISSSSAIAAEVEQCVLSCREGTARLQKFLGKCRENAAPLNFRDRLRDCRQRAIYPFRQSSLDSLKEIVRDLENNLGTALQVLQLDISEGQVKRTSDLVNLTKSTAVSVEGASHCISNVEHKIDQIIFALSRIQPGVTQYASHGPIIHSSITEMERRTQAIESLTSQILPNLQNKLDQLPVRIQESMAESTTTPAGARPSVETTGLTLRETAISEHFTGMDEDARKLQLVLAQRPSLLRNVCDEVGGLKMDHSNISMMTTQNSSRQDYRSGKWTKQKLYCSCTTLTRRRAATYSIGRVKFFKDSVDSSNHSATCPLYIRTETTTTVGFKMGYYGRLLANTVRATISITTGAGGYSINPCLKFHAVVPNSSPAFRLLDHKISREFLYTEPLPQSKTVCDYFNSALKQLYELFQDGRASPTDTNESGQTLLHRICDLVGRLHQYDTEVFQSSGTLLKGLIAAGVPLNEADYQGQSALDHLAECHVYLDDTRPNLEHKQVLVELCTNLFIAGGELLHYSPLVLRRPVSEKVRELEILATVDGLINDSYGPLSVAIVHRSESDIKRILQNSRQTIYEQNSRGQTPLHLSCNWPKGIILLFHYGALELVDREDNRGSLPLEYSYESRCAEAVQLILEADSALLSLQQAESEGLEHFDDKLWVYGEQATDEISSHVQNALVDRRRRLMSLAITQLCHKDLEELGVTDDRLLDEKAFNVYKALERRNVVIPSALRIPLRQTTVFHYGRLTPAVGESLYKRGFLDVDGIDSLGFTPLMILRRADLIYVESTLERASWLISKGANPGRKTEQSLVSPRGLNTTAAHYLCFWVGSAVDWYDERRLKHLMQTMWFSDVLEEPVEDEVENAWLSSVLKGPAEDYRLLLGKLFSSNVYDSCVCACSSHGCIPAIRLLRSISVKFRRYVPLPIDTRLSWMIKWFSTFLGDSHEVWQWLSQEIIRFETFKKLDLTHTCCEKVYYVIFICTRHDRTEREEIRDEERFLISKLETLVAEFTEKYTELGVSLPDFLNGYWKTRMEEVERDEKPLDDEEIAKIEELGVVIHS